MLARALRPRCARLSAANMCSHISASASSRSARCWLPSPPKRWELIAALREAGPLTVADLARRLGRNYKNVHTDVTQLIAWMTVERAKDGRVSVPWSEIVVDMKLPGRAAA